jgi:hypothetical protein
MVAFPKQTVDLAHVIQQDVFGRRHARNSRHRHALPYGTISLSQMPNFAPIARIGNLLATGVISMSIL